MANVGRESLAGALFSGVCSEGLIITGWWYYDLPPSTLEIEHQLMNDGEHVATGD
jgi:hypothetical protein